MTSCLPPLPLGSVWSAFGLEALDLPAWFAILGVLLGCAFAGSAHGASDRGADGKSEPRRVREPILAGHWYEGGVDALRQSLEEYLRGEGRPSTPRPSGADEAVTWAEAGRHPIALLVPHAGHVYSGACAGEGFRLLRGSPVERVILLGPSHRAAFRGAALPEETAWRTPLGEVELDRTVIRSLQAKPGFQVRGDAHADEHCLEVEVPFLQQVLAPGFRLIPMVIGRIDRAELASIATALHPLLDERTILVISTDFTHYGTNFHYLPFHGDVPERLRKLDLGAADRILSRDLPAFEEYVDSTGATICGAEPIRILLKTLEGMPLEGRLADYYRSGDLTGDYQNTVSYASIAFFPKHAAPPGVSAPAEEEDEDHPPPLTRDEQAFLLDLARRTVRAVVDGQTAPDGQVPARFPAESPLHEERGVFVTLTTRRDGQLRGCIGSILGDLPLSFGVVQNATSAALHDPRFAPVEPAEEPGLHLEISVLTPLHPVASFEEIRVGRDGVLLERGGRRAVFLPQVAPEQGWDRDTMLRHLAMKAGLGPNDWKSGCTFHTFQAQVFEEVDAPGAR